MATIGAVLLITFMLGALSIPIMMITSMAINIDLFKFMIFRKDIDKDVFNAIYYSLKYDPQSWTYKEVYHRYLKHEEGGISIQFSDEIKLGINEHEIKLGTKQYWKLFWLVRKTVRKVERVIEAKEGEKVISAMSLPPVIIAKMRMEEGE